MPKHFYVRPSIGIALSFCLVFLSIFLTHSVWAEESDPQSPVECEADVVTFRHEEQVVVGEGHVEVVSDRFRLTSDYAEVHLDTKDVLAKGNVILYEDDNIYRTDELRYNFDTRLGSFVNSEVISPPQTYGRGVHGEKTGPTTYTIEEGYVSTCEFAAPHYSVQASSIDIYWDDKIVTRNVWYKIGNERILWLPYYVHYFHRPSVRITPGKNKDFGFFTLTSWGWRIGEYLGGRVHLDWRERLGFGGGVDVDYRTPNLGAGRLETYYARERSRHEAEGVKAEDERWRMRLQHVWDLDDKTKLQAEYFEQSDSLFTQDYFEDEFQTESNPESFVSLTRVEESGFTLFANLKKRANRHQSVTETLPEVRVDVHKQPVLLDNLFYDSTTNLSHLNTKSVSQVEATTPRPSFSTTSDTDAVRFDNFHRFTYAYRLFKWLDVSPEVNYRATWWSKEANGADNIHQTAFGTGVGLSTRFYRVFNVSTNFWGLNINRLRHLVTPSVDYVYNRRPTVAASRIIHPVGSGNSNVITLSLGNLLQTKRGAKNAEVSDAPEVSTSLQNVNLADFVLGTDYTFGPEGGVSKFSNITGNLELRPYPWLVSEMSAAYDHIEDRFDSYQLDVILEKGRVDLGVGYGYTAKSSTELTAEMMYRISPLWSIRIFERFDLRRSNVLEQEYTIERELHDFFLSLNYNVEDSESIWIVVRPKAFPDMNLFKFTTSYHQPKLGRNF